MINYDELIAINMKLIENWGKRWIGFFRSGEFDFRSCCELIELKSVCVCVCEKSEIEKNGIGIGMREKR